MLRAMDQKELWMVQAVDQGAIEAAMGAASDGSGSNGRCDICASDAPESSRRSDGWCKLWIREQ